MTRKITALAAVAYACLVSTVSCWKYQGHIMGNTLDSFQPLLL